MTADVVVNGIGIVAAASCRTMEEPGMHSNRNTVMGLATPDHLTADDLAIGARSHATYERVTARPGLLAAICRLGKSVATRWYSRTAGSHADRLASPLARLDCEVAELRNAGGTEAEARHFELHVRDTIDRAFGGRPLRDLPTLYLVNAETECAERMAMERARLEHTPEAKEAEGNAALSSATADIERAKVLFREARRDRVSRFDARARLGLPTQGPEAA